MEIINFYNKIELNQPSYVKDHNSGLFLPYKNVTSKYKYNNLFLNMKLPSFCVLRINWSEITGYVVDEETINDKVKLFDGNSLFQFAANINRFLNYNSFYNNQQESYIELFKFTKSLLKPQYIPKYQELLQKNVYNKDPAVNHEYRPLIDQATIFNFIKKIIIHNKFDGGDTLESSEKIIDVAELLFACTDHLSNNLENLDTSTESRKTVYSDLSQNIVFNNSESNKMLLSRYFNIYFKIIKDVGKQTNQYKIDVFKIFEDNYGITLESFFVYCFGIYCYFFRETDSKLEEVVNNVILNIESNFLFDLIISKINQYIPAVNFSLKNCKSIKRN